VQFALAFAVKAVFLRAFYEIEIMSVFRVSACLFCVTALIAPVHGQQVLWNIDSSAVSEESTATELRMVFRTPGGDYAAQGAAAGAALFEGSRNGARVTGIAWSFTARCAAESYEVAGSFSTDEKVLALTGRAPVRDAACKITSFQDKTLVLAKKAQVANTSPAPPPVAPPPAVPPVAVSPPATPPAYPTTPSVSGRSYWAHNGSTLYLVANGNARELYYDKPRPGMAAVGAQPGSLLFRGVFSNGSYTGTAFIFSKSCGSLPYQVSGPVTNNYETITLRGQAPSADASCNVTKTTPDTLEFALCVKTIPSGATALLCP
jgi:hypothetical protein